MPDLRGAVVLAPVTHRWECPSCDLKDVTVEVRPHSRMHACRGQRGMTVPMVPAGVRAEHRLIERGDYTNGDLVQTDGDGRVWMAVQTMRDDGYDTSVYAPTAVVTRD